MEKVVRAIYIYRKKYWGRTGAYTTFLFPWTKWKLCRACMKLLHHINKNVKNYKKKKITKLLPRDIQTLRGCEKLKFKRPLYRDFRGREGHGPINWYWKQKTRLTDISHHHMMLTMYLNHILQYQKEREIDHARSW